MQYSLCFTCYKNMTNDLLEIRQDKYFKKLVETNGNYLKELVLCHL